MSCFDDGPPQPPPRPPPFASEVPDLASRISEQIAVTLDSFALRLTTTLREIISEQQAMLLQKMQETVVEVGQSPCAKSAGCSDSMLNLNSCSQRLGSAPPCLNSVKDPLSGSNQPSGFRCERETEPPSHAPSFLSNSSSFLSSIREQAPEVKRPIYSNSSSVNSVRGPPPEVRPSLALVSKQSLVSNWPSIVSTVSRNVTDPPGSAHRRGHLANFKSVEDGIAQSLMSKENISKLHGASARTNRKSYTMPICTNNDAALAESLWGPPGKEGRPLQNRSSASSCPEAADDRRKRASALSSSSTGQDTALPNAVGAIATRQAPDSDCARARDYVESEYFTEEDDYNSEEFVQGINKFSSMVVDVETTADFLPWKPQMRSSAASFYLHWMTVILAAVPVYAAIDRVLLANGNLPVLSDLSIAVGSFIGLFSYGVLRPNRDLEKCYACVRRYVAQETLIDMWYRRARVDWLITFSCWLCAVVSRLYESDFLTGGPDVREALYVISFCFASAILLSLTMSVLYVCSSANIMIDNFCIHVLEDLDLDITVERWKIIQTFLRKSSEVCQQCFFVLQTTALVTFLLGVLDLRRQESNLFSIQSVSALIPGAFVALGIARIVYCSAVVTDKCVRVPAIVNSVCLEEEVALQRHCAVAYIINTDAGIHVYGVRFTAGLLLKTVYVCIAMAFAMSTRI